MLKKILPILFIVGVVVVFFWQSFFKGLLPIPSDTIIGLYNPFRDIYAASYPNGIPFKNFLLTDPVRQQYPWRKLAISLEKNFSLPLWNPYAGAGTPLLANHQSGPFYPFNIIFFFLPFSYAWSLLLISQPLLAGLFLYFYLRESNLSTPACILGSIAFAFCGFSVAWLEWNTIVATILWLPLILLSIDKVTTSKKKMIWWIILSIAFVSSFFAGHLQTFFYVVVVSLLYFLSRLYLTNQKVRFFLGGLLSAIFVLVAISIQLLPLLQLIQLSARSIDVVSWTTPGWLVPWQNIIQFIVPDFFGNPATLNYWGIWNYGEFIGYIGIVPLLLAVISLGAYRRKKVIFFVAIILIAFLFAFPTPLATLPFILKIPFLSTAQPTRLISVIDFGLAILAAFGFDYLLKTPGRRVWIIVGMVGIGWLGVWGVLLFGKHLLTTEQLSIARRNVIIPTVLLVLSSFTLGLLAIKRLPNKIRFCLICLCILFAIFDLYRFFDKFTPFTPRKYLFPETNTLTFLQKNINNYRFMTTDSRILPPNFATEYQLQSVDIYDPLYIRRYGEFIAAMERNKPDISTPFGFNRIITPHSYVNSFVNLLGVKYILSLTSIHNKNFKEVFKEGQTHIYENLSVLPRAFFVRQIISSKSKQDSINKVSDNKDKLGMEAIVEGLPTERFLIGTASISLYTPSTIDIATQSKEKGFLILTDVYYPTWHAFIDGKKTKIYMTDFTFRGVQVPAGKHTIEFKDALL